jgi:flavorubredoxin
MGHKNLLRHFSSGLNYQPVENGGELTTGKKTLSFLETRMLHCRTAWDLRQRRQNSFSSDAFGQHYAGLERLTTNRRGDHALRRNYFANILLPFSDLILKLAEKITAMGLALDIICPDHGIIWRKNPGKIINAYLEWSAQSPKKKALVIYDTMWQSTRKMAETIVEGLGEGGIDAKCMNLRAHHRSDIMTEVLRRRSGHCRFTNNK